MTRLTIPTPDDFHIHLRDGSALSRTVPDAAKQCARALVMPNLTPAVDTVEAALAYRERIMAHVPDDATFTPLMALYLSDKLTAPDIHAAKDAGIVAVKWYPKGATTNSAQGVASVEAIYPVVEAIEQAGLLLLIHGEVTHDHIDIFDREATFIDSVLAPLRTRFPKVKMVLEHLTTRRGVEFVQAQADGNTAATITAQHLLFNRNALLVGGVKPHYYCLPILKTEDDRQALRAAAISGDPRFFLGTDSAPHIQSAKENACGCAGCYSAYHAPALYAEVFDRAGKLDRLADFACGFGADYYGIARNGGEIRFTRKTLSVPDNLPYADAAIVPLEAGQSLRWSWEVISR